MSIYEIEELPFWGRDLSFFGVFQTLPTGSDRFLWGLTVGAYHLTVFLAWDEVKRSTGFRPRGHGFIASWLSTMTA